MNRIFSRFPEEGLKESHLILDDRLCAPALRDVKGHAVAASGDPLMRPKIVSAASRALLTTW